MAIVFNNDLTLGLRGRVGKTFVFRAVGGRTIVSCAPRKPDPRKQSAAQRRTRANFKEASAWAVRTLMDAEKKLYYQRRAKLLELPNAYIAAVRDYMRRALDGLHFVTFRQKDSPAECQALADAEVFGNHRASMDFNSATCPQKDLSFSSAFHQTSASSPMRTCHRFASDAGG